ncbi:MAG: glycerol-3-phosphate responsive antiterminator [Lachnospiraceae bacterium]|nr:glycerol-3-phosphate responsive antiterminator [Lachnospiraceae bacterium]
MHQAGQKVIPAISTMKEFEKFLEGKETYGILMNFHISLVCDVIKRAHEKQKKLLLHLDLIKGLSSDESGCEYACQYLQVDGIISTKGKVIETARRNHRIAILRLFLIDSKSLEKGLALCQAVHPDYMEVLPGIACSIIPYIKEHVECPIMCGGLIKTPQQVETCLEAGAFAVTATGLHIQI